VTAAQALGDQNLRFIAQVGEDHTGTRDHRLDRKAVRPREIGPKSSSLPSNAFRPNQTVSVNFVACELLAVTGKTAQTSQLTR
jgi:hypothetical protein